MNLNVVRFSSGEESTLGLLLINGNFACYTLEDEARTIKIFGETRIPAGRYRVGLRTEGGFHNRYSSKFPRMHKGMLHIQKVPNFEYILIHIGNQDDDTAGCLLVGDGANNNLTASGFVRRSTAAYRRIYPIIANAVEWGEEVWIDYSDHILNQDSQGEPRKGRVNAAQLNLRLEPGSGAAKSGILNHGTEVEVRNEIGGWYEVNINGWVYGDYVSE
jgi:hypothetical protein